MTTVEAAAWRKKFFREGRYLGGAFVAMAGLTVYLSDLRMLGVTFAVGLFGFLFQRRMTRTWKCEDCGKTLHRKSNEGDKVVFCCDLCEVRWDTRVEMEN